MAGPQKWPLVSYQPFRLAFQISSILAILAKVPYWLLIALVPRLRPVPQWSFIQTILARMTYNIVDLNSTIGITETLTLKPAKEGDRFRAIQPPLDKTPFSIPPFASDTTKPVEIGGTWFPKAPTASTIPGQAPVVLHLHGGAFVLGDGRTAGVGFLCNKYIEEAGCAAVFSPQYRLSGYDRLNPFPAALQDTLTAYLHLTQDLGVSPSRIVISGDSAGGNLAIALLRFLSTPAAAEKGIPGPPRAVVVSSPWVSPLGAVNNPKALTTHPNFNSDYLPLSFLQWGARTYCDGIEGDPASNPYIELLGKPFAVASPVFVTWGEAEVFAPDISAWAEQMRGLKENAGGKIVVNVEKGAPHDTFLAAELVQFQDTVVETMRLVRGFLNVDASSSRLQTEEPLRSVSNSKARL